MPLTDPKVAALKYVEGGKNKHPDYEGLLIDIRPPGANGRPSNKVWRYRYRVAGKENVLTIGRFPEVGVKEARRRRDEARELVTKGRDPNAAKRVAAVHQDIESRSTFGALLDEWLATRTWAETTRRNREATIDFHLRPHLGAIQIREITPMMVLDVLRRAGQPAKHVRTEGRGRRTLEVGSAAVALRMRQYIAGVFALAIASGRADSNPAGPLRSVMTPARQTTHKTPLKPAQVGKLFRALDAYRGDPKTVLACRLLWWTLLRPGELVAAHWSEFDLDAQIWTIPRGRMKVKKAAMGDHRIPLPDQAVDALRRWHTFTGGIGLLFEHRDRGGSPMLASSLAKAFGRFGLDFDYSPHATRTTASTTLNEMGFRYDVIERALDHEDRDAIRRAYNRADYFVERKQMLQQWADLLDAWKTGAKVLVMQPGKTAT